MSGDAKKSIGETRQGFEKSFETETFYNNQTQDAEHLKLILDFLNIDCGAKILDLGTGTGYLAFPLAELYPQSKIVGLDIVEKALCKNRQKAESMGLMNLQFISYDGLKFPFADQEFDLIVSRYALHHFPQIYDTFQEISRVLKPEGKLFLSDPSPNENDKERFVDTYMRMKKDGHIKFYRKEEWEAHGERAGLKYVADFETKIRFSRLRKESKDFETMISQYDCEIIKGYDVEIAAEEIWITERVNNLLFQK